MNRASTLALFLLLIAGATYFLVWGGGRDDLGNAPAPSLATHEDLDLGPGEDLDKAQEQSLRIGLDAGSRALMLTDDDLDSDAVYQAALAGFKGRILSAHGEPVEDTLVQLFRFAPDVIFGGKVGLFVDGDDGIIEPNIDAGETRTSDEGRFLITGVVPQAFFLLKAGVDSDAPSHRIIDDMPGPGEIIDLGDILLDDAGILVGEVVDADSEPIAGALIRAVDLSGGEVLSMVPIERFDPEGALIITAGEEQVISFPKWVKRRFEQLPIPSTRSDAEGNFRLVGVAAGSNIVAITAKGHLSKILSSVKVRAGKEKSLGRIRLRDAEEVFGMVLDEENRPVADAEVYIANLTKIAPVHIALPSVQTDAEGNFEAIGFSPGSVVAAARRGPGHPWIISEPQSLANDVILRLPALHRLTVTLRSETNQPIEMPRLQLTPGTHDEGSVMMTMLGIKQPVDLSDRLAELEDGRFEISNLGKGTYTLLADSEGHAAAAIAVQLETDQDVSLTLPSEQSFMVFVGDENGEPVRNAAVYAQAQGQRQRLNEMPVLCGRSDAQGLLEITKINNDRVKLSAQHPAYGSAHAESPLPPTNEPVTLLLATPGSIEGILTDKGQPPLPGKWSLVLTRAGAMSNRGAMPDLPVLTVPDLDGKFEARGLKPGNYTVTVFSSLDSLRSPGAFQRMVMETMMNSRSDTSGDVEVYAGQVSRIELDAAATDVVTGPSGMLHGNVLVDGRVGSGLLVRLQAGGRRTTKEIDQSGHFDFGMVEAGKIYVQLLEASNSFFSDRPSSLWQTSFELEEGDDKVLNIVVSTTSIAGSVLLADSTPVVGARVRMVGRKHAGKDGSGPVRFNTVSDERGHFAFPRIPEAIYNLSVKDPDGGRAHMRGVEATAVMPRRDLHIVLEAVVTVSGRVAGDYLDSEGKPARTWLQLLPVDSGHDGFGAIDSSTTMASEDGSFEFDDVTPGTYRMRIHGRGVAKVHRDTIAVGPVGLANLIVYPVEEQVAPAPVQVEKTETKGK